MAIFASECCEAESGGLCYDDVGRTEKENKRYLLQSLLREKKGFKRKDISPQIAYHITEMRMVVSQ